MVLFRRQKPARLRVLIVDDDPFVRRFLHESLAPKYDVTDLDDSVLALAELLDDPSYDVVLCDVQMPGATGPEIFSVLERAGSPVTKRFLFMTGGGGATELIEACKASMSPSIAARIAACPVVHKPLSHTELVTGIDRFLDMAARTTATTPTPAPTPTPTPTPNAW